MIAERLGIALRRAVAWWIDAFLVAAIVTVVRWLINTLASTPLSGRPEEIYEAVALAVAFYIYRVWVGDEEVYLAGQMVDAVRNYPGPLAVCHRLPAQFVAAAHAPDAYRLGHRRHYPCNFRPFGFSHRPNAL